LAANLFIVSAPSGAGKSSFVERLCAEDPRIVDVITYTTRPMRAGESQGQPYYFVSPEDFFEKEKVGFFVEHAKVHNHWYGTPLEQFTSAWAKGLAVIMDVDVQGAEKIRARFPENSRSVFILPPSLEELKKRLIKRSGGKPPDDLELRLSNAEIELKRSREFDFEVVNDDFELSYRSFKKKIDDWLTHK
jgi:guanylate kinase